MATNKQVFTDKKVIRVVDSYTYETKIYCGCQGSHKPTGSITTMTPEELEAPWIDERQRSFINLSNSPYGEELDACPACGRAADLMLYANNGYGICSTKDYAKLYDNGHLISMSIGDSTYTYIRKQDRIFYNHKRTRYTFNANTGITYYIEKGKIRNISLPSERQDPMYSSASYQFESVVKEFESLCIERRGLKYLDMNKLKGNGNYATLHTDSLRMVLRFPALQNLPEYQVDAPLKKDRQFLLSNPKSVDLFRYYTGHASKRLRKLATTHERAFKHLCKVGYLFDRPEYVEKILTTMDLNEHGVSGFYYHGTEITPVNNPEHPLRNVKRDFEEFRDAFCHGDISLFMTRLLAVKDRLRVDMETKEPFIFGMPWDKAEEGVHYEWKEFFSLGSASRYIVDSMKMYRQIREQAPEFHLKLQTSIQDLHDQLSIVFSRIRVKNRLFPMKDYQANYDQVVGGIEFRRAESTHRLVDIGKKMGICVGSYGENVFSGHSTIIQAYVDDQYAACLEVNMVGRLVQAKTNRNLLPNLELHEAIKVWAKKADVSLQDCHDMVRANVIDLETKMLLTEADTVENVTNVEVLSQEQLQAILDTPLTPGLQGQQGGFQQAPQYVPAPAPMAPQAQAMAPVAQAVQANAPQTLEQYVAESAQAYDEDENLPF